MQDQEEARKLRERYRELAGRADRLAVKGQAGVSRFVGKVFNNGAIPTSVPSVYLTHPATIFSPDTEGGTATATVDTSQSIPVWVVGPGVPVANDYLIARGVNYRYAADFPSPPGCLYTVTVTTSLGAAISGATVQIKSGATVIATGTTDGAGQVTLNVVAAATYTRVVSKSGLSTVTTTVAIACGDSATVVLPCNVTVTVTSGCDNSARSGAAVQIKTGATVIASGTTNGSGQVVLDVVTAGSGRTLVVTDTSARFAVYTATVTTNAGGFLSASLSAATGYICCSHCPLPIASTLFLTDNNGTHTITSSGSGWGGSYTISTTGCDQPVSDGGTPPDCIGSGASITDTLTITIRVTCPDVSGKWQLSYNAPFDAGQLLWWGASMVACRVANYTNLHSAGTDNPFTLLGIPSTTNGCTASRSFTITGWLYDETAGRTVTLPNNPTSGTATLSE